MAQTVRLLANPLEFVQQESLLKAANALYRKIRQKGTCFFGKSAADLWPAAIIAKPGQPELVILPLDRLGAEAGKSGHRVVVAYFHDSSSRKSYPSKPFVVKVSPGPDDPMATDRKKELRDEVERTKVLRQYLQPHIEHFAIPVEYYDDGVGPGVLWAPFTSAEYPWNKKRIAQEGLHLRIRDLWRYLSPGNTEFDAPGRDEILAKIGDVLRYLVPGHQRLGDAGAPKPVNIVTHYEWELRGILKNKPWAKPWHRLWAGGKERLLSGKGSHINPLFLLKRLKNYPKQVLPLGVVHGDLHPKNIVFDEGGSPHVIDFGWLRDMQHVAKDFVLLECNLRFMTLPPYVSHSAIETMAKWLALGEELPAVADSECELRCRLIREIRSVASEQLPAEQWDVQYNLPLFLVSMGLLKHCHQATCQAAAIHTVMALSRRVDKALLR